MPRQFRPSVCHTRVLYQNGWTYHRNSFTIWQAHHSSFSSPGRCVNLTASNTRG